MKLRDLAVDTDLDPQVGLLLAVLDDVTSEWREELGEVGEEAVLWQPFPGGHSIGALILHIADVEAHWLHEVGAGQPRPAEEVSRLLSNETDQYKVEWPNPPAQPLAWYFAQQDDVRVRTKRLIAEINDLEHIGQEGDESFTLRYLLNHVISHEAYHGGQAVLLSVLFEKMAA